MFFLLLSYKNDQREREKKKRLPGPFSSVLLHLMSVCGGDEWVGDKAEESDREPAQPQACGSRGGGASSNPPTPLLHTSS